MLETVIPRHRPIGLALLLAALMSLPALADRVELRSGEVLEGTLATPSWTLETENAGDLVVPTASIRAVRFAAGDGGTNPLVTLELVDGTELTGRFRGETLELDRGLYASALAPADVARVEISPRAPAAAGSGVSAGSSPDPSSELLTDLPVDLLLAEWLHSSARSSDEPVRLCLARGVFVGDTELLPRGTPATARVVPHRSRDGEIAIQPHLLLLPGGRQISLRGEPVTLGERFNTARLASGGVAGFSVARGNIQVAPGAELEARLAAPLSRNEPIRPGSDDDWQHCRELLRFTDGKVVPFEQVDPDAPYAPFGDSLAVSLPLDELIESRHEQVESLRNLVAYDTYLHALRLALDEGGDRITLDAQAYLAVLPSHDKRVTLTLTLLDGSLGEDAAPLARDSKRNVDAEEEKSKDVRLTLEADKEAFERAAAAGTLQLLVEMVVRE